MLSVLRLSVLGTSDTVRIPVSIAQDLTFAPSRPNKSLILWARTTANARFMVHLIFVDAAHYQEHVRNVFFPSGAVGDALVLCSKISGIALSSLNTRIAAPVTDQIPAQRATHF